MLQAGPFNAARLRFIAAGFCALILQLAVEQAADASCGDWLANHSPTEMAETARPSFPGLTDSKQHVDRETPAQQPAPCHGPLCHNTPAPASPPVPVETTQTPQQWLKLTVGVCQVEPGVRSRRLPQSELLPESASRRRLERPPCC
ncbi:MAG: hypothetical protein O2945_19400 [Planctomycetota bacterium]|nr:hypothetical protein [Planctomycetota bacterium]